MLLNVEYTDSKPYFSQEKRSHYEPYKHIPKVVIEHDQNKINKFNQYLAEKKDHIISLYYSLIIVLPTLTWGIARSFIILDSRMKNKKCVINILISFLRLWSRTLYSATMTSEKNWSIGKTLIFVFHHSM